MFENIKVRHIVATESDHCFVLAGLRERLGSNLPRGPRPFSYDEDVWQTHIDYDKLVFDKWRRGAGGQGLQGVTQALQLLQGDLASWEAREFECLARKLREKLSRLRTRSVGRGTTDEEKEITKQLKLARRQKEIWIRQRSRV